MTGDTSAREAAKRLGGRVRGTVGPGAGALNYERPAGINIFAGRATN